jgi:hypothetical protein
MSLKDTIEDTTREYVKSGRYSKKKPTYASEEELKNLMMSLKAYHTWLKKSRPRDSLTYYRGYIVEPSIQPFAATMDRKRVEKLRDTVYDSYLDNLVTLVQKKHGSLDYEYIAVKK